MKLINSIAEFEEALSSNPDTLIMIDFFAEWCGPCKQIGPRIEQMEKKYDNVVFYKVDVDVAGELAEQEEVTAMPTFKFYKGGKQVDTLTGANEANIIEMIEKYK